MGTGNDATLDLRLPLVLKEAVVEAAAHLGQSVDEFAVGVLARTCCEKVIAHRGQTVLSDRDWERLLTILDDLDAEPNEALRAAATRYESHIG